MIKAKTLKKVLFTLAFFTLVTNQSQAGLIKPQPKPQEFKLQEQVKPLEKKPVKKEKKIM